MGGTLFCGKNNDDNNKKKSKSKKIKTKIQTEQKKIIY